MKTIERRGIATENREEDDQCAHRSLTQTLTPRISHHGQIRTIATAISPDARVPKPAAMILPSRSLAIPHAASEEPWPPKSNSSVPASGPVANPKEGSFVPSGRKRATAKRVVRVDDIVCAATTIAPSS